MYSRDTAIAVRPFTRQQDGNEVVIGNAETGVFLAVPTEAVDLLDELAGGKSIGEVCEWYRQMHGETPDLDDFLGVLEQNGMIEPLSEETEGGAAGAKLPRGAQPRYHFSAFPQALARAIFSGPILAVCFLVIALGVAATARYPQLRLSPADLFFPDYRTLTWIILLTAYFGTIFVHEFGHLVAARALGIKSRMGISHRLWYLVAETDLTGLWAVPKRQRYLPIFAGILIDAVSASLLVLLLFASSQHWMMLSAFSVRLTRALAFTYLLRIAWEFFLFLRTDIYFAIATFFSCKNLLGDTRMLLRNQMARFFRFIPVVDQTGIPAAERRVIRVYAWVWMAGQIWALATLFMITAPVGCNYFSDLARVVKAGYSTNPADFTDSVVLSLCFLTPTIAGFVLWGNSIVRGKRT